MPISVSTLLIVSQKINHSNKDGDSDGFNNHKTIILCSL